MTAFSLTTLLPQHKMVGAEMNNCYYHHRRNTTRRFRISQDRIDLTKMILKDMSVWLLLQLVNKSMPFDRESINVIRKSSLIQAGRISVATKTDESEWESRMACWQASGPLEQKGEEETENLARHFSAWRECERSERSVVETTPLVAHHDPFFKEPRSPRRFRLQRTGLQTSRS